MILLIVKLDVHVAAINAARDIIALWTSRRFALINDVVDSKSIKKIIFKL